MCVISAEILTWDKLHTQMQQLLPQWEPCQMPTPPTPDYERGHLILHDRLNAFQAWLLHLTTGPQQGVDRDPDDMSTGDNWLTGC